MGRAITKDVFDKIEERFHQKYGIKIKNHIANLSAIKIGRDTGAGITFVAKNHGQLALALESTGNFRKDDRSEIWGALAAAATTGDSWREIGKPGDFSLHCQVARSSCNIHLDRINFTARGPDGQVCYTLDALLHIGGELVMAKLAQLAYQASPILGEVVSRIHPMGPTIHNRYKPMIGLQFEIASGESIDLKRSWRVTLDLTRTCKNLRCGSGATFAGVTLQVVR